MKRPLPPPPPPADRMMDLSDQSKEAQMRHAKLLQELEVKRRMHKVRVPTLEKDVKTKLREIGHPITLFGEKPEDRLKRLKLIVAAMEVEAEENGAVSDIVSSVLRSTRRSDGDSNRVALESGEEAPVQKKFYTPASADLKEARRNIANFSFGRSQERLKRARVEQTDLKQYRIRQKTTVDLYNTLSHMLMNGSQFGDSRPLTSCALSKDDESRYVATSSWSGSVRLWDRSDLEAESTESSQESTMLKQTFRGHEGRVQFVEFRPQLSQSAGGAALASAATDGAVKLWSLDSDDAIRTLHGHKARLCRVKWHPMGRHVGSTSYDTTWRLWDAETGTELLLQEGHAKETYGIAFHPDGSLVATGDLGGIGHVWDLRSGKSVFVLREHVKEILSMDWSPNGTTLATGSGDRSVRLWDLRKRKRAYALLSHSGVVSTVKFAPRSGEFLLTASFDKKCKLWNTRNWAQIAEMAGHDGHVTGADISQDEKHFVTSSFDRTWKHWAHESEF
eukprot:g921.t1